MSSRICKTNAHDIHQERYRHNRAKALSLWTQKKFRIFENIKIKNYEYTRNQRKITVRYIFNIK